MNHPATLRTTMREQRRQLSQNAVRSVSNQVFQKLISLSEFQASQHIAGYFSNENEIDLVLLIDYAKQHNKKLYFPVLENKLLRFCLIDQQTKYKKNVYGILEPEHQQSDFIPIQNIDLFLIPVVAFDAQCHRIGRGAGYYDRTLAHRNKNATLIGLAYEFQKVDHIKPCEWDVGMHYIVTEEMKYDVTRSGKF